MNAAEFVKKWAASRGAERRTSQEHFIDLCRLLDEKTPNEADPSGDFYAFEKGARKPDGEGFADVWLKGRFAWEYKGKRKDLAAAYKQVSDYREAVGAPLAAPCRSLRPAARCHRILRIPVYCFPNPTAPACTRFYQTNYLPPPPSSPLCG